MSPFMRPYGGSSTFPRGLVWSMQFILAVGVVAMLLMDDTPWMLVCWSALLLVWGAIILGDKR